MRLARCVMCSPLGYGDESLDKCAGISLPTSHQLGTWMHIVDLGTSSKLLCLYAHFTESVNTVDGITGFENRTTIIGVDHRGWRPECQNWASVSNGSFCLLHAFVHMIVRCNSVIAFFHQVGGLYCHTGTGSWPRYYLVIDLRPHLVKDICCRSPLESKRYIHIL